ncbi:PadR family transcriptional regulator [Cryobacterium fucosi]|uniref:PadR family transcriptional regulator n=1 Tax=Cryobacterium fucosi TaxID=1259157 RepID=A0A4R9AYB2_9MICO|nr:PadR family transcriptional regulator [Cryobacterium fucosi]TFD72856.1 PadR family transcriptional regulator [Cryobacterium fucosi]
MLGPQTLYDLNKHCAAGISLFYRPSLGGLSSATNGLLAKRFVEFTESVANGRSKKTYRLTIVGRSAFLAWMKEPIAGGNLEVIALTKVYFLGLIPDPAGRQAILADIVRRVESDAAELDELSASLDGLTIPAEHSAVFHYQRLTLDYGIGAHGFGLAWFRELLDDELRG